MDLEFVEARAEGSLRTAVASLANSWRTSARFSGLTSDCDLGVWTRCDFNVRTARGTHKGGPEWDSVVGRVTVDARTREVLCCDSGASMAGRNLHKPLVARPIDTLTALVFTRGRRSRPEFGVADSGRQRPDPRGSAKLWPKPRSYVAVQGGQADAIYDDDIC